MNMKNIFDFFLSLRTTLWFLGLLIVLFLAGAFIMPGSEEFQKLHFMPLFEWIIKQPFKDIWWLWGIIFVLAVIALNTVFCSFDSLIKKRRVTHWLLLISPQIIHIGFIFMLTAHLLSAFGSYQKTAVVRQGTVMNISGSTQLKVNDINIDVDYYGYITGWTVDVQYTENGRVLQKNRIMPNSPSVFKGLNINVKDVRSVPVKAALLQINREPGALWALAGGILFIIGIVILVALKRKIER
jgi:hypothetical protein